MGLVVARIEQIAEPGAQSANDPMPSLAPAIEPVRAAANEPEVFFGKGLLTKIDRTLASADAHHARATSRAATALNKLEADRLVSGTPALETKDEASKRAASEIVAKQLERMGKPAEAPATPSRAEQMAARANEQATTPPTASSHLEAFEATNRQIVEAQQAFSEKWGAILGQFPAGMKSADDLHDAIRSFGRDPSEYDADVDGIRRLSMASAGHLERLTEHLNVYRRKNGDDDEVRETGERIQNSLHDLAAGPDGTMLHDAVEKLKELIKKVVEMIRALFGKAEPK